MYKEHKDIPLKYRRLILDEAMVKRISKVPISTCNEIINNHLEEEEENESLKDYEVEFIKDGEHGLIQTKDRQSALVEVDRVLEYGENTDSAVMIAVRQAKRLIAAYANGGWLELPSKDALVVKRRSSRESSRAPRGVPAVP